MKRWDDYKDQGTIARDWEYDNHRSDIDWEGHCHAWSVASYDATEPWVDRPPFNVGDLKGLIRACYYDSYIHAIQWDCSYPSNFWIALRNQIYSQGSAVIMDLKLGVQVWNYPIFEYDIDYTPIGSDSFNCLAAIKYERDDVNASFVGHSSATKSYNFTVYMPGGNPPPQSNSGTWTGSSTTDHPDVAWYSTVMDQGNPHIDCNKIVEIIEVFVEDISKATNIPMDFALSQNHPNPFNPITEIKYALPKDCWVKLEVYNILSRKVATLVDREQKAGYKVAKWDAGSFSSGIYFYRIKAGDFTQTKKMVLLE
jgi:hypothetical protein